MLKPKDVIVQRGLRQEDAKEKQAGTRAKARQEASLRKLEDALPRQPPRGHCSLDWPNWLSLSQASQRGLDTLLEQREGRGLQGNEGGAETARWRDSAGGVRCDGGFRETIFNPLLTVSPAQSQTPLPKNPRPHMCHRLREHRNGGGIRSTHIRGTQ